MDLREERDVLVDREVAVQAEALRQVTDARRDLAVLSDGIDAEDADRSGVGVQQAAQQANRRRLAGAVRTDETEHLAAVDVEGQRLDSREPAVALRHTIE